MRVSFLVQSLRVKAQGSDLEVMLESGIKSRTGRNDALVHFVEFLAAFDSRSRKLAGLEEPVRCYKRGRLRYALVCEAYYILLWFTTSLDEASSSFCVAMLTNTLRYEREHKR